MSPMAKTSGWPGQGEVGQHLDPSGAVDLGTARLGELGGQRRGLHPGRPDRRVGLDPRRACRRLLATSTPKASTPTTLAPMRSSTPMRSSSFVALPDSRSPNVASGSLPPSSRITRTDAGSNVRNSPLRQRTASSRTCPASSTPVGPAPTMTMVSHFARSAGSSSTAGHLEGAEDPPAQLEGVVDRLHTRRVAGELVVPEVRLVDAGGDDEAVVGDLQVRGGGRRSWRGRCAGRGRTRSPRPARRGRSCSAARRGAAAGRSAPATACPWPPGTAAAGTGGGCAGRSA